MKYFPELIIDWAVPPNEFEIADVRFSPIVVIWNILFNVSIDLFKETFLPSSPSGNSLNVTIPNLTPKTRYYVKYAFISAIDEDEIDPAGPTGPGSYTVSDQLTAVVLEENISV